MQAEDISNDAKNRSGEAVEIGSDTSIQEDIVKPDKIVEGHSSTPKTAEPGMVIDHIDSHGVVDIRTFYGDDGMKRTEIHAGNHGNCKTHNFGVNGEHVHEYIWNEDGSLNTRRRRELTNEEKERNSDIFDKG